MEETFNTFPFSALDRCKWCISFSKAVLLFRYSTQIWYFAYLTQLDFCLLPTWICHCKANQ